MMLGIDPKTLRHWLKQAKVPLTVHPSDARLKCLTLEQAQQLASLHHRPLQAPASLPAVHPEGVPETNPAQESAQAAQACQSQQIEGAPTALSHETALSQQLTSLEAKVSTMQEQFTQLALALLREQELHYEQRLSTLEALVQPTTGPSPEPQALHETALAETPVACPRSERHLLAVELRARTRVIPLIEYGAQGCYVAVCPQEGVLPFAAESPEWFDWLASLTSFRFLGQQGRFTAYRESKRGEPTRGWVAHRGMHGRHYKRWLGVTDHLTLARLEQMAASLQSHLNELS
jgi:hypothetical protein